ncbi:MAG: heavy metal sensor histidine kinase [Acidobacteria bacterium]|nr:heavy metal sensor histidine kinase [Acidobacteriota bacterium]
MGYHEQQKAMLSIRSKLTLWYLAILAIVLIGYGIAIYLYLSTSLLRVIDTSLRQQVIALEQRLWAVQKGEDLPEEPTARLNIAPQFVELIGPEGQTTDMAIRSDAYHVAVNPRTLERVRQSSEPVLEDATTDQGKPMRVATWRLLDETGQIDYFIRAGYLIEDIRQAERQVLLLLVLSIPVVLLLASWGGRLLANKALKPVAELTQAAQTIGAKNLKERVEVPATQDELARLAETFNQMISRLDEAFERERRFTEDASHELRTPLAVMRNEIEVALRRERSGEEYKLVLQRCLEEVLRLTKLVDDLLMLARADTSESMLDRQPVKLDGLCQEMVDYVRPLAEERGLRLDLSLPDEPIMISGDARRLQQLMLNLLDNAIKYTPAGGRIQVEVERCGAVAAVKVLDTGGCIPAEDLPHIFERFYRRRHKADGETTGFGLGLAICKWIVEAHGGTIEVASELGQGTRFIFHLPILNGA